MPTNDANYEGLKVVTQKSLALFANKEIILPSVYRVVFSSIAKKNAIDIGAESIHTREEINDDVIKHIYTLDSNTSRAIEAIKKKDEEELSKVLADTRRLQEEVASLRRIAYEDGLTKALNRKWFEEQYLEEEREVFKKEGVIALIDLNNFKHINDNFGHAVGDKVLVHLASRFKELDANVVRYGGDEFMLVFDNESPEEVHNTVHILRELYMKKKFRYMNHTLKVSYGYGITPFKKGEPFSSVVAKADELLYVDKDKVKERLSA